jgi:hypothetical protein
MAIYTVHAPPPRTGGPREQPEHLVFVRDGFHVFAFLVPPLWMLVRGLWLVLIGYLVLSGVLQVGLWAVGAGGTVRLVANLLLSLLIGLEASSLLRWTLARRGWTMLGLVVADDVEAAERRFYDAWVEPRTGAAASAQPGTAAAMSSPPSAATGVFGLFPEPGGRR